MIARETQVLTALAGVVLTSVATAPAFGQQPGYAALNDYGRNAFISAAYGTREELAVQLLSQPGRGDALLKSLREMEPG